MQGINYEGSRSQAGQQQVRGYHDMQQGEADDAATTRARDCDGGAAVDEQLQQNKVGRLRGRTQLPVKGALRLEYLHVSGVGICVR